VSGSESASDWVMLQDERCDLYSFCMTECLEKLKQYTECQTHLSHHNETIAIYFSVLEKSKVIHKVIYKQKLLVFLLPCVLIVWCIIYIPWNILQHTYFMFFYYIIEVGFTVNSNSINYIF
jgi:hypothetical protein